MPSVITRTLLFLSSYFALLLIVFLENLSERPVLASVALSAGFVGILGMGLFLLAPRHRDVQVDEVEHFGSVKEVCVVPRSRHRQTDPLRTALLPRCLDLCNCHRANASLGGKPPISRLSNLVRNDI
jgi:hypothetical protein